MDFPGSPRSASSSSSYHTAPRSPMSIAEDMSAIGSSYRSAVPMTEDIRQHIHIYLDEGLYYNALILLTDLVTAGASCPNPQKPIYAPAPLHIELVSALLIHPKHTNQAPAEERAELASQSITFLRNVLAILGPLNANLADAFSFTTHSSSRTLRRSRNAVELDDGSSGSDTEDGFERMRGVIANKGRIRNCAKDFWHMVGWAFNCSVKYPKRWKFWKVWLDFMLDVLDADWKERETLGADGNLENSLLLKYLSEVRGRSSPMKRVIRSAFAAGTLEDLQEFPQVFANETKELKVQNGQKRKRGDPMERKLGHYEEEEASSAELTDQASQDEDDTEDIDSWIGGPESIMLRQRVVTLLSRAADALPEVFVDCKDLYEAVFTCVKPLPLPAFSLLLSPSTSSQFPTVVYVSLTQLILRRFLPSSAPRPGVDNDELSQVILEQCYLPFSATTSSISDNAKVSILVESLLRLLVRVKLTFHTPSLDTAIEDGIKARESRFKGDKKKKDTATRRKDEKDMLCLRGSGQRLRSLFSWIEQQEPA
ncbi:uncharacterized protein PAC_01947 [Phialocephala subalpina]|uniref:Uncharacterized protein n=1 Tax=Phialocephala subalpina TaxID=576137 RepID=A0A1L7WH20_9HELO|nr:uncharacterized protein PAC_01947 [Phialocephala subalpina]